MSEVVKMSLSDKSINLIPIDVDINQLFSLSYTFDNLKLIMNTLLQNQNIIYDKIKDLETNFSTQNEDTKTRINQIEKKIRNVTIRKDYFQMKKIKEKNYENNNNINLNNSGLNSIQDKNINDDIKDKENEKKEENKDNKENKEINEENNEIKEKEKEESISFKKKEETNILSPMSGSQVGEENQEDDLDNEKSNIFMLNEEIENLKNKLETFEQKLNTIEKNSKFNPNQLLGETGNNDDIKLIKLNQKSLEDKINEINKDKDEMKKELDEMKIKIVDFNIVDILKEANISEGSIDASKLLVMNLEEKFVKKTQIIDEKIKKNEDDMYNLKNEFQKVANEAQVITMSLDGFKSAVKEITEQVTKTNDDNSSRVNETNNKINEIYKKVLQKIEEEKKNSKKNYDKIKNYIKKLEGSSQFQNNMNKDQIKELSEGDLRCLAELTKRITDLEKQMKMLYHSLDISKFKEEVAKLENDLMQKIDEKDFFELSNKVNINTAIMNNIKESLERAQDLGNKNSKDLNFFLRKLESVNATVIAFKAALEALSGIKNENIFDPSRYLDIITFNEFIKAYHKDVEKIEKNIEDVRRLISELSSVLKSKASGEDMKTFEGIINNKLEEIKLLSVRKFSDKIEMNKNFKYIDAQIKHLTTVIMKKNEKNESWLLAKKPIGGHICASCEAYIGDLKGKDDFLVWNKYPKRNKEKNFRIGNGFSHMLNMLNLDIRSQDNYNSFEDINNINNVSDNENKNPFVAGTILNKNRAKMNMLNTGGFSTFNRSNVLPKIPSKNEDNTNSNLVEISDKNNLESQNIVEKGQINSYEENNVSNSSRPPQPHIVKVYRKNKYSAPDITKSEKNLD